MPRKESYGSFLSFLIVNETEWLVGGCDMMQCFKSNEGNECVFSHLATEMAYVSFLQELPCGPSYPVWLLPPPVSHGLPRATAHCHAPGQMDVSKSHRTCGGKHSSGHSVPCRLSCSMNWLGRKLNIKVSLVPEFMIIPQMPTSADHPTRFWLFWQNSAVYFAFPHNALCY